MKDEILLSVEHLTHSFSPVRGLTVRAVDDLSFSVQHGEIFGLVGESGSGKSTAARCIMNLYRPDAGHIFFHGIDVTDRAQFRAHRAYLQTARQMIFQDSTSSLDPRRSVCEAITEPLRIARRATPRANYREEAAFQMKYVGLDPVYLDQYPAELSGGQRQRVAIARALSMEPELLVADEPVSSLDVSIQAQIINLLKEIQKKYNLTYLFISHDLSVVEHISDTVGVMYLGNLVEYGATEDIFRNPLHPYTKALFSAIPIPDPTVKMNRIVLEGSIPSPANPPKGCKFHTRCANCMECCKEEIPVQRELEPGHFVACHLYDK